MRSLLEAIGENPTEEELQKFMADVDEGGNGEIEFSEFLRAFEKQRGGHVDPELEADICTNIHACIFIYSYSGRICGTRWESRQRRIGG